MGQADASCVCLCFCRLQGVVVDSEGAGGVSLMRVPSAVRELLPHKPYQAPEANPLPGAEVEPDCCSICLVELESGEQVTVLPCMHFYHKVGRVSRLIQLNCQHCSSVYVWNGATVSACLRCS
jgi:hypothetical protein